MRLPTKLVSVAVLVLAFAPSALFGQTLKVGSKNLTEQLIVAELYAAALEAESISVERKLNLGPTPVVHKALLSGDIDLYPEYTGTALGEVMKVATNDYSPKETYQKVKAFYEQEFKLLWLTPSDVDNGYVLVARPETAQAMKLKTLSDLARVSKSLKFGGGPEFGDRRDGLRGLKDVYGIEFGEYRKFADLRLRYEALKRKDLDIVNGFATDWQIAAEQLSELLDNKRLFPPYVLAPVVRMDTVVGNDKAVSALNRIGTLIDNATMRELNRQVEVDGKTPRQVAEAFLKQK
jgi:osmoprotectant transport system substrate-binding protein